MPRVQGQFTVYRQRLAVLKLTTYISSVETKMAEWVAKGQDVTTLKAKVESAKKNLSLASEKYDAALSLFAGLKVSDYPAKETIKKARTAAQDGNKYFVAARSDILKNLYGVQVMNKKMIKQMKKGSK